MQIMVYAGYVGKDLPARNGVQWVLDQGASMLLLVPGNDGVLPRQGAFLFCLVLEVIVTSCMRFWAVLQRTGSLVRQGQFDYRRVSGRSWSLGQHRSLSVASSLGYAWGNEQHSSDCWNDSDHWRGWPQRPRSRP